MKRILTIVLCFVLLNKAFSQAATADRVALDIIYQHINKAAKPNKCP